jgi:hypothetical protein
MYEDLIVKQKSGGKSASNKTNNRSRHTSLEENKFSCHEVPAYHWHFCGTNIEL